jgi:anthranilate synthase/aminodeoxychorismate synthase-like glutamine amidotransferase
MITQSNGRVLDLKKIVMIDNYDSFTFNLVQYLQQLGGVVHTIRNDACAAADLPKLNAAMIVISPGPSDPENAGISIEAVRVAATHKIPLLGVCLGHQSMGAALGAKVIRAPEPKHGKTSEISHDGKTMFEGIKNPLTVTRYHSLIVSRENLPPEIEISAQTKDGIIMAMRHRSAPIEGVQFHPESVLTESGLELIGNFARHYVRS